MTSKRFVYVLLVIFLLLTGFVAGVNYYVDPLWHYKHANKWNKLQVVINEREQKTAILYYQKPKYDTLLIGSSRSTYIQPSGFSNWKVFNYAVSNMSIREYESFILFARKQNPDIERVLIGVDFFKASTKQASAPQSLKNFEAKVTAPLYRQKSLLSFDLLQYARQNIELSEKGEITEERLYNRSGDAFAMKVPEEIGRKQTEQKIVRFENEFYGENFVYYPQYKEILTKAINASPNGKVVLYTTPISSALFSSLVSTGLFDEYEQWLRDLVATNGSVWNFMYPNSVTNNIQNYFDGHHFYPEIGELIAEQLEKGETAENVPSDFGVLVTKDNIDEHLLMVKSLVTK